jgi:lysophospholipase L1-like esterase
MNPRRSMPSGVDPGVAMLRSTVVRARIACACVVAVSIVEVSSHAEPSLPPSPWTTELDAFVASDAKSPPAADGLVLIGSSSIRLWNTAGQDFHPRVVINRGFGGAHMADVAQVVDRFVVPYSPRCIVVYAGDNDIAAGKTPEQVRDDFMDFVTRARRHGTSVPIVFVSIKPSPARRRFAELQAKANRLIQESVAHAGAADALYFADVWSRMIDVRNEPRHELFGSDGLHMSPAGYRLWVDVIAPIVERAESRHHSR